MRTTSVIGSPAPIVRVIVVVRVRVRVIVRVLMSPAEPAEPAALRCVGIRLAIALAGVWGVRKFFEGALPC